MSNPERDVVLLLCMLHTPYNALLLSFMTFSLDNFPIEIKFSFPMPQVLDRMGVKEIMEQLLKQVRHNIDMVC
jgi:hypothetical protein